MMNRETVKKLTAVSLCALLVAGVLFSAAFACFCAKHEHDQDGPGGSCAVCAQLVVSERLQKLLSVALVAAAVVGGCSAAFPSASRTVDFRTDFAALVCLKIRLNC